MQRRVFSVGTTIFFVVFAWLLAVPAIAQQLTTISISEPHGEISDVLRHGHQLELERRWGDALLQYEEGLRQHPADAALQQRFDSARLHYDLQRRYSDRSYCDTVARLSLERALELYSQVLLKIDSYYVEVPRWNDLVGRGSQNLDVALGEPTFIERNVADAARPALDAFRRELRDTMAAQAVRSRDDAPRVAALAARLANQRLGMAPTAVVFEYLCGATSGLDVYSTYLTPDQLNEQYAQIDGNFIGLGVELKAADDGLAIVRVIAGSPAEQAGIRAGDRILVVDGRATKGLTTDQAANLLQGEENSIVAMTVAASGRQPRQLAIRRRRVDVPSIEQTKIIDPEYAVGYFKLTCFQKTTTRDLDAALWKLHHEGMKSLVIDLRGNPGGVLDEAIEVADRFIERGVIVRQKSRIPQEDLTYSAREQGKWRMPLVVLIDQDSASAAEILAVAIHDHQRGTIVGVRSFGKGSSQGIFPLEGTNAGVRITTATLYSPNGHPWSHIGIDPDILVQSPAVSGQSRLTAKLIDDKLPSLGANDDPILARALQEARKMGQVNQAQQPRSLQ